MVTRLLVRLLVHRSSVTGLPLVRLLVHRSCVCSTRRWCVVGVPLARRCPIAVHGHWSVAHPSGRPLLVRLFE